MCAHFCIMTFVIVLVAVLFAVFYSYLMIRLTDISDIAKCPYCYGKTFCENVNGVSLDSSMFGKTVNWFNTKNVYYGDLENIDVVVKKLGSDSELNYFDGMVCDVKSLPKDCDMAMISDKHNYTEAILESLSDRALLKPFQICTSEAAEQIFEDILKMKPEAVHPGDYLKNVWTTLQINVEPLILQLLRAEDGWPFPKYYGACGRLIIEEHRGITLLDRDTSDWMDRAYFAAQLLRAAKNLTEDHPKYRFYLTDISPDNIAIDDKLKLTFVDLENLIVQHKNHSGFEMVHKSEDIHDSDGFAFSAQDLCEHDISDHNYYAICKLILSKNAPYPMTKNGLLNSPPRHIILDYPQLFDLIEDCSAAEDGNRFEITRKIFDILIEILRKFNRHISIVVGN